MRAAKISALVLTLAFFLACGLDQQSFEKAIREVTESAEASKRYADAYRKASV